MYKDGSGKVLLILVQYFLPFLKTFGLKNQFVQLRINTIFRQKSDDLNRFLVNSLVGSYVFASKQYFKRLSVITTSQAADDIRWNLNKRPPFKVINFNCDV